jgi:hypothetical protein
MKYEVTFLKSKKKGYAKHSAVFLKIDDAIWYETILKSQGAKDIIICPK